MKANVSVGDVAPGDCIYVNDKVMLIVELKLIDNVMVSTIMNGAELVRAAWHPNGIWWQVHHLERHR